MSDNTTTPAVSADPLAAFPHIPVHNTLGAWLLGVAGSLILNGMIFHQTYRYFKSFRKDRLLLKIWVVAVMLLETFTTALTLHTAYFYLVIKYWEPTYFFTASTIWSINLLPIPGSIAALISQSFFARRVWIIAPKFRIIVGVATILISGNVGCFTALSVKMFNSENFTGWLEFSWLASVGSSIQMAGDLMITSTLIYVLQTNRPRINGRTESMVDLLIMYAVSTGVITCIVHILNVAFSIAYPDNFVYAALSCVLTKLYANTFLVALNSRKSLGTLFGASWNPSSVHTPLGAGNSSGPQFRSGKGSRANNAMTATMTQPTAIELKVVTEVTSAYDEDMDMRMQDRDKDGSQMA